MPASRCAGACPRYTSALTKTVAPAHWANAAASTSSSSANAGNDDAPVKGRRVIHFFFGMYRSVMVPS